MHSIRNSNGKQHLLNAVEGSDILRESVGLLRTDWRLQL